MSVILSLSALGTAILALADVIMVTVVVFLYRYYRKHRYKPDRSREWDSKERVGENHDILGKEQIDAMLTDSGFGQYGETFALAALKRRLHFLDSAREKHEGDNFFIETNRIGRALKISWCFKPKTPTGSDIVGFRRTGGFFPNQWDESNNGTLVIHSDKDGESTESLNEGEAVYYTFFLKPWREGFLSQRRSALRFQVTISTTAETDALKMLIARLQESSFNPSRPPNISRAVKELGVYVEFDNAIKQEEKMLAGQIKDSDDSQEEKQEKLSRLRDVVAAVRDKYQQ